MKKRIVALCMAAMLVANTLISCGRSNKTETKVPIETEKVTESPITDMELVMSHHRARYYDPFENAEQMKEQANKGAVVTPNSGKYSSDTIVLFDGYDDNISEIEIYFKNFSTPADISLEQAVEVAYHYLSHAIIDIYYDLNETYLLKSIAGGENYYIIKYVLNDAGKKSSYSGQIDIIFTVSVDSVSSLVIASRTPRWMTTSSDEYDTMEWEIDTSKYMK